MSSRVETLLKASSDDGVTIPKPQSRLERLLYKHLGYDIDVPEPQSRTEILLDAALKESGGGSGTEEIKNIIDDSGVLEDTEGSVSEKVEQLIDYAKFKNIIQESIYANNDTSVSSVLQTFRNTSVTDVSMFDFSKKKHMGSAFGGTNIEELEIDVSCAVNLNSMCMGCKKLKRVVLKNMSSVTTTTNFTFHGCNALESVETLDISGCTSTNMFPACSSLKEVRFVENCILISTQIKDSPLLSAESIQSIIDGLATVETAQTLILHSYVTAKLTTEQFNTILSKNWELI